MAFAGVTHSAHAVGSALRTPRSLLRRNHETVVAAHVFLDQSNRPLWLVHSHYRSHVRRFSFVSYRARTHAHHLCISTSCLMGYTSRIKPYKRGNIRCTSCDRNIQTSLISASLDLMYTYLYHIILLPSLSYTTISYSYLHYGRRLLYAHFTIPNQFFNTTRARLLHDAVYRSFVNELPGAYPSMFESPT